MNKVRTLWFAVAVCAALTACKREAGSPAQAEAPQPVIEELPRGQPPAPPMEPPEDATQPVTVSADAVKVGSSLGPDQSAISPKSAYSVGDTVYASARAGNAPRGATAYVYWTYEDGISHKEEQKPVAGSIVMFDFSQKDGMKSGRYNVEIGVNDTPIGIVDFVVQ
jgi:hypothetical protein